MAGRNGLSLTGARTRPSLGLMRRLRFATFGLVLAILSGSAVALGRRSERPAVKTKCSVRLDADVSGGQVRWILQAAVPTGQEVRLRARALGCSDLYLIRATYLSRPKVLRHQCGQTPCFWRVASASPQALDFEAAALPMDNADCASDHICDSNVVRVAWAGSNRVVGEWAWYFAPPNGPLVRHGTVTLAEDRRAHWSGGNEGDWLRSGPKIEIRWSNRAVDNMTLSGDSRTMTGPSTSGDRVKGVRL